MAQFAILNKTEELINILQVGNILHSLKQVSSRLRCLSLSWPYRIHSKADSKSKLWPGSLRKPLRIWTDMLPFRELPTRVEQGRLKVEMLLVCKPDSGWLAQGS